MNGRIIRCIDLKPPPNTFEQLRRLPAPAFPPHDEIQHWIQQLQPHPQSSRQCLPSPSPPHPPPTCLAADKENFAPEATTPSDSVTPLPSFFSFNKPGHQHSWDRQPLHTTQDIEHNLPQPRPKPSLKRKQHPSYHHHPCEPRRSVRLRRESLTAIMAPGDGSRGRDQGAAAAALPPRKKLDKKSGTSKQRMEQEQEHDEEDSSAVQVPVPTAKVTRAARNANAGVITAGKTRHQAKPKKGLQGKTGSASHIHESESESEGNRDTDEGDTKPLSRGIRGLGMMVPELQNPSEDRIYDEDDDRTPISRSPRRTSWEPRPLRKKSRSPTKPTSFSTFTKSSSTATSKKIAQDTKTITKTYQLAYMTPPIKFNDLSEMKAELPQTTVSLWTDYLCNAVQGIGAIPLEFKDRLDAITDTPMKTRPRISPDQYGSLYDKSDFDLLWETVSDIAGQVKEYRNRETPESHWIITVVQPLLQLVRKLKRFQATDNRKLLEVLDITTIEISPLELCPYSADSVFRDIDKRIDAAIGLQLTPREREFLERGSFETIPSINQTATFANLTPMFASIEVKRRDKDPLIQLGAWVASEFEKRKREDYSLDMPAIAITVIGDKWDMYLVYARQIGGTGYGVNFVGPRDMGSTTSMAGIFKILNCLCCIAEWGTHEYRAWVETEILSKYGWTEESEG